MLYHLSYQGVELWLRRKADAVSSSHLRTYAYAHMAIFAYVHMSRWLTTERYLRGCACMQTATQYPYTRLPFNSAIALALSSALRIERGSLRLGGPWRLGGLARLGALILTHFVTSTCMCSSAKGPEPVTVATH